MKHANPWRERGFGAPRATCHPDRKHNAKGLCLECYNEQIAIPRAREWYAANRKRALRATRAWHLAHPEQARASRAKWQRNNPEKIAASRRAWEENNPEKLFEVRRAARLAKYGMTVDEFAKLLKKQRGRCALCARVPRSLGRFGLNVDHCHKTLKIRGLLCNICNMLVGMIDRDPRVLTRLWRYVRA